jgi:hypothetical protein
LCWSLCRTSIRITIRPHGQRRQVNDDGGGI